MRTHDETYDEATKANEEAAEIENRLNLPALVDKEAYVLEIAAFTLMRLAYELLLNEKQEVKH